MALTISQHSDSHESPLESLLNSIGRLNQILMGEGVHVSDVAVSLDDGFEAFKAGNYDQASSIFAKHFFVERYASKLRDFVAIGDLIYIYRTRNQISALKPYLKYFDSQIENLLKQLDSMPETVENKSMKKELHRQILFNVAGVLPFIGQSERALQIVDFLKEYNPTHPALHKERDFILALQDEQNESSGERNIRAMRTNLLDALDNTLTKKLPNLEAHFRLVYAKLMLESGDITEAQRQADVISMINPNYRGLNLFKALMAYSSEAYDDALRHCQDEMSFSEKEMFIEYPPYEELPSFVTKYGSGHGAPSLRALSLMGTIFKKKADLEKSIFGIIIPSADTYYVQSLVCALRSLKNTVGPVTDIPTINLVRTVVHDYIVSKGDSDAFDMLASILDDNPDLRGTDEYFWDLFLQKSVLEISDEVRGKIMFRVAQSVSDSTLKDLELSAKNVICQDVGTPLTSKIHVVKSSRDASEGPIEDLQREYAISRIAWNAYAPHYKDKSQITLAEPFQIFKSDDGRVHLLFERINQPILAVYAYRASCDEFRIETDKVLKSIAEFHGRMTPLVKQKGSSYFLASDLEDSLAALPLEVYDPHEESTRRFFVGKEYDKFPRAAALFDVDSKSFSDFIESYRSIEQLISSHPKYFIHGDMHMENAVQGGVLLDLANCCIGNPMLDLSMFYLALFPSSFPANSVVGSYVAEMSHFSWFRDLNLDVPDFLPVYQASRVHNALCFLGTCLRRNTKMPAGSSLLILDCAMRSFPELKEKFDILVEENSARIKDYFSSV